MICRNFIFSICLSAFALVRGMECDIPTMVKQLVAECKQSDLEKGIIERIHSPELVESLKEQLFEQYAYLFSGLSKIEIAPVVLSEETGYLDALAVSPCGKYIAIGSSQGIVHVLTLKQLIATKPAGFYSTMLAEIGKAWNFRISDAKSFDIHTEWDRNRKTINCLKFSPDGNYLITGGNDARAYIIDIEAQTIREIGGHTQPVIAVSFSPDGSTVATGCRERKICLWDVKTGECLRSFRAIGSLQEPLPESCFLIAFHPVHDVLVVSSGGKISLWDILTGDCIKSIKAGNPVYQLAFHAIDPSLLAAATETYAENDDEPCVVNLDTDEIKKFYGHTDRVTGIEFSPCGTFVATSSYDGTSCLWNSTTSNLVHRIKLPGFKGRGVTFSPCGKYWLSSYDNVAGLWGTDGAFLKKLDQAPLTANKAGFSKCGRYVLATSYKSVILWDIAFVTPELMKKHLSLPMLVCLVKLSLFSAKDVLQDSFYKKLYSSLPDSIKQRFE